MSSPSSEAQHTQIAIIGGGIAGLSLAAELARRRGSGAGITVLESCDQLATQTSARSAQQLIPSYGPEPVLELTRLTIPQLVHPEPAAPTPLAWPSPFVVVGSPEDVAAHTVPGLQMAEGEDLYALCPELAATPERFRAGAVDDSSVRTDAPALIDRHIHYLQDSGTQLRTGAQVNAGSPHEGSWRLELADGAVVTATTVVNAAGAWADTVAQALGMVPQGLRPLRRTAALVELDRPLGPEHPMVCDAVDEWYYRPDPAGAMISWGEAEPSEACDAQPWPGAVAGLIDTLERLTSLRITAVQKQWTGLRTETPHDVPVCGWDSAVPAALWLAGQGGYGFQTSSAMARAAADLVLEGAVGSWLSAATTEALRPRGTAGA